MGRIGDERLIGAAEERSSDGWGRKEAGTVLSEIGSRTLQGFISKNSQHLDWGDMGIPTLQEWRRHRK